MTIRALLAASGLLLIGAAGAPALEVAHIMPGMTTAEVRAAIAPLGHVAGNAEQLSDPVNINADPKLNFVSMFGSRLRGNGSDQINVAFLAPPDERRVWKVMRQVTCKAGDAPLVDATFANSRASSGRRCGTAIAAGCASRCARSSGRGRRTAVRRPSGRRPTARAST